MDSLDQADAKPRMARNAINRFFGAGKESLKGKTMKIARE
jgi:hypothetical protein